MKTNIQDFYLPERCWVVEEIPQRLEDSLSALEVHVTHPGVNSVPTTEALEQFILPLFKLAPKLLEVVSKTLHALPEASFTDAEKRLIQELADVPRYAIGTEHLPDEFGMWWGPNPSLPQALMQRPSEHDVLFKLTAGKQKIIARSNGSKWVVEPQIINHENTNTCP